MNDMRFRLKNQTMQIALSRWISESCDSLEKSFEIRYNTCAIYRTEAYVGI